MKATNADSLPASVKGLTVLLPYPGTPHLPKDDETGPEPWPQPHEADSAEAILSDLERVRALKDVSSDHSYLVEQLKLLRDANIKTVDRLLSEVSAGKNMEASATTGVPETEENINEERLSQGVASSPAATSFKKPVMQLATELRSSLQMFQALAGPRVDVSLAVDDCPDCELLIYSADLSMILINLIRNAANAMTRGDHIVISAGISNQETSRSVNIVVEDDGMGIPIAVMDHIFESNQTSASSNGPRGSLPLRRRGFALQLVRELVESGGGSIKASRAGERGSRFIINLPMAPSTAA